MLNDYFFSKFETLKNTWFEIPQILKFLVEGRYFHCLENPLQIPEKHFQVHQLNLNCLEHTLLWERGFAKTFSSWGTGREQEECAHPKSCNSQGDRQRKEAVLQQADATESWWGLEHLLLKAIHCHGNLGLYFIKPTWNRTFYMESNQS